jgi:hypothetical protein
MWTAACLIHWLDRKLCQEYLPQAQMIGWMRRNIECLAETRKILLASLMIVGYVLMNKVLAKITTAR